MARPTSVSVFGVLNIVFGVSSFCCLPFTFLTLLPQPGSNNPVAYIIEHSLFLKIWTIGSVILGLLASIVLIIAGVGLMMMKDWGRKVSIGYGIYAILMCITAALVNVIFLIPPLLKEAGGAGSETMAGVIGGAVGGTVGVCASIIYPVLLIVFMTRPGVVEAFKTHQANS